MHTVFLLSVWLTLGCVWFDFYWISIKICWESVPLRQNRKKIRGPEGFTKIGKVLWASFIFPEGVFKKRLHKTTKKRWANGKKKCSLCPRTSRVNQNWFTILHQNRKSESNLIHSHTAPKRALCGAAATNRTRIPAAKENRRLGRFGGCGAARAVQLNTRE